MFKIGYDTRPPNFAQDRNVSAIIIYKSKHTRVVNTAALLRFFGIIAKASVYSYVLAKLQQQQIHLLCMNMNMYKN